MVPRSRARDLVESYPMTEDNYPKALAALKERFGNEDLLVEIYCRELIKLVINNNKSQNASMLYLMVESCIPDDVLRACLRSPLSTKDGSHEEPKKTKLDFLMSFLKSEVDGEESSRLARAGFGPDKLNERGQKSQQARKYKESEDFPTAAGLFTGKEQACIFCEKSHDRASCGKSDNMTLEEKKNKVQKLGACFSCLKK
jgi:hypothetical protein